MSVSVGVVGLGMFGPFFIEPLKRHPDVGRLALCDLDEGRLRNAAQRYEVGETYSSLDEICQSGIQALVIITQHWMHAPQAVQAMEAGKHVYTACPCAWSLQECDQLVETVKRTGQLYMNGETSFFRPETAFCREKFAKGEFGEIVYCEGEYFHDMDHGLYDVVRNRWGRQYTRDKDGEPPMHYPTHSTSFAISVTGAHMTKVACAGYAMPSDDWYRADTRTGNLYGDEIALFRMSNGAVARIAEMRRIGHPGCERCCIYGTRGSFEWGLAGARWATKDGCEEPYLPLVHEPLPEALQQYTTQGHGGAEVYLMNEFVSSVRDERLPRVNVWQAVRYLAPGIVAHQSAIRDGEWLDVPDWGDPPSA